MENQKQTDATSPADKRSEALALLDDFKGKMTITLEHIQVGEKTLPCSLTFHPGIEEYNALMNAIAGKEGMVTPAHNYLARIVEKEDAQVLAALIQKVPGALDHLMAQLNERFVPQMSSRFLAE